jgi:hypothetical protein
VLIIDHVAEDGVFKDRLSAYRLRLPTFEDHQRFPIQWQAARLLALRSSSVNGEPAGLQVDVGPPQLKQLTATHACVQRQQYERSQVIYVCCISTWNMDLLRLSPRGGRGHMHGRVQLYDLSYG